jgi:hypothetical protein
MPSRERKKRRKESVGGGEEREREKWERKLPSSMLYTDKHI